MNVKNRTDATRLPPIPALADLERAYATLLQPTRLPVSAGELSVFSQWSRFDPRLAEIYVSFLAREWEKLNPIELRKSLLHQRWPSAAAVLLEFAEKLITNSTSEDNTTDLFRLWRRVVTEKLPKGNWEQFFIGLRKLGGQAMQEDARFAFSEYRKWGYLGRDILINKGGGSSAKGKGKTTPTHSLSPETRREILTSLCAAHPRITTQLYWNAIHQCISRRQAERDLESSPLLRTRGSTKGRYFLKR